MILAAALLLQAAAPLPAASVQVPDLVPPQRQFSGIWLDEFEGTQFFEGAHTAADLTPWGTAPALSINRSATLLAMLPSAVAHARIAALYQPHLYRIRFVGRVEPLKDCRPQRVVGVTPPPPPPMGCIGVGGVFPAQIVVAKVFDLADLGPLPARGQPASQLR